MMEWLSGFLRDNGFVQQGIGKVASRIADISEEQAAVSNNIMRLKSRLSDMEAAKRAIETHKVVTYEIKDRLSLSQWLEG